MTETMTEKRHKLTRLQSAYVASVRDRLRGLLREARTREQEAARLWAATLEVIGGDVGLDLPPDTRLEGEGEDLELVFGVDEGGAE